MKLFKYLSYAKTQVKLADLAEGKTIAVDGDAWAHEFVAKHAREVVVMGNHKVVVEEFKLRCSNLAAMDVGVVVVLDGRYQVKKSTTDQKRLERRMKAQAQVEGLLDDATRFRNWRI